MRELNAILDAWRAAPLPGGVLATVVHVEGSAYRRPGARMWIGSDGHCVGTISGGCLEGEVARKASWWTAGARPVLRVYDTSSDDDAVWEFGLGCNGVISVLLERSAAPATAALLTYLDACQRERRATVVATVVRAAEHSCFHTGDHFFDVFPAELAGPCAETLKLGRSRLLCLPDAELFLEHIAPPQRLVVFGAGHDVVPVVNAASLLGWEITVADVRSGYTKAQRFPGAARVVTLPPNGSIAGLDIGPDTAVVMMTHNFPLDEKLLPQILPLDPPYLGLLGPWQRTERLYRQLGLRPEGVNLHAPVGLDLGGDAPESIALAIVAEIQSVFCGRTGAPLRWRRRAIHDPAEKLGATLDALPAFTAEFAGCEIHG
ncbi:MAG: XdhC family protein [Acidobacteria bacterium]|nr:XdhC family protein [Acidobacteriota bacterium]